jgi:hypothetical protein
MSLYSTSRVLGTEQVFKVTRVGLVEYCPRHLLAADGPGEEEGETHPLPWGGGPTHPLIMRGGMNYPFAGGDPTSPLGGEGTDGRGDPCTLA